MQRAKNAFRNYLPEITSNNGRSRRNIFRPNALALVSRNKKWFEVGSSMAVSNFLRPPCLYDRIFHFKPSLKKAVILVEPLDATEGTLQGWHCFAFNNRDYKNNKDPCQNCQKILEI